MPVALVCDFNSAHFTRPRGEGLIHAQYPTLKMTSTKIELSTARIRQLTDPGDLAEILFPATAISSMRSWSSGFR